MHPHENASHARVPPPEPAEAERIRELEKALQLIFLHGPMLGSLSNIESGRYLEVNERFLEVSGFRREEVIGRTSVELGWIPAADRERVRAAVLREGRIEGLELELRRKDGAAVWCRYSGEVVVIGGAQCLLSIAEDITERRRAEAALRQSEARYRTLFEEMINGVALCEMIYDPEGHPEDFVYLDVNRAFARATGLSEVVGKRVSEVIPGIQKSDPELFRIYGRVAATGHPECFEIEVTALGRWFQVSVYGPEPGKFVAVFDDVSERKRAEQALRESEARLRLANEVGHIGTYHVDLATGEVFWSNEMCALFGVAPGTVHDAEGIRALIPPEEWGPLERSFERSLDPDGDHLVQAEHRVLLPEGALRWCSWRGRTFFQDAPGGRVPVRQLGVAMDITARVEAAALRETDRKKDDFLAVLSHELRNPLTPIRNSLLILERATPGGEQARRAQAVIERQVSHLSHLVDDLLDVTRIARGKVGLKRERLELVDLVRRTLEDHRGTFAEGGVALSDRLTGGPIWLDADAARLVQVIGNLLANAAKFTPAGGHVELTLEREGQQAVLRVRDDGMGIAPEVLTRLFEPFTQAPQTLARSRGGLGLGLALVKGLVELHGGSAVAASAGPGLGAEVTIRLPLEQAREDAAEASAGATPEGRRLLVIEDNADAASSLQELLELLGHEVRVAGDGPTGLAAARAFEPDLVLCDVGLPGMNGYDVARAFRADPRLAQAVLVALTGYALPEDRRRAAEAGFAHHLAKPIQLELLERLLAQAPRRKT